MPKKSTKSRAKKVKRDIWFKKVRGSYLPASWQGWLTYVPFILYLVAVLIVAFNTQDTFFGYLMVVFPQFVAATVVMTYVASKTS